MTRKQIAYIPVVIVLAIVIYLAITRPDQRSDNGTLQEISK